MSTTETKPEPKVLEENPEPLKYTVQITAVFIHITHLFQIVFVSIPFVSYDCLLCFQTWVLKVSIHCEGCKRKVKKVLRNIDGN